MKKRFFYISNIRLPTEKAHGIQIMEMCQAFADQGLDVELIATNRKTQIKEDPFVYYDIRSNFRITKLPCLDVVRWGRLGFWLETFTFTMSVIVYSLFKKGIFYTRDEFVATCLLFIGKNPGFEIHMGQKNLLVRLLILLKIEMIVISQGLGNLYLSLGVSPKNIFIAPDGADINRFDIDMTKEEARKYLGLPLNKQMVLYKGTLGKEKGVDTLARAASDVKTNNILFIFIGGGVDDVEKFRKEFANDNIRILGNRPRTETPIYQRAADILVIPNSAKKDISKLYTSPMKLFGYMAGGRPLIASDLPSLREVLNKSNAYFFNPDDPKNLAESIDLVLGNYDQALLRSKKALEEVREYSWEKRAKKILNFIQT